MDPAEQHAWPRAAQPVPVDRQVVHLELQPRPAERRRAGVVSDALPELLERQRELGLESEDAERPSDPRRTERTESGRPIRQRERRHGLTESALAEPVLHEELV